MFIYATQKQALGPFFWRVTIEKKNIDEVESVRHKDA